MKFSLFTKYGALNSTLVFSAFENSLMNNNHIVVFNELDADVAVVWSVLWKGRMQPNQRVWNYFRSKNKPVIVLEVGNFIRGTTWKIGINGIGKRNYCLPELADTARPAALGLTLSPWTTSGEFILICGQQSESLQWYGQPAIEKWFVDTIQQLQRKTQRPIILRPHPRSKLTDIEKQFKNVYRQNPQQIKNTYDSFDLNFDNVYATVNWNSNPGVNSIISGIPAFVGPDSLAYDVAETDISNIESLTLKNRDSWLTTLSYTEYTLSEIAEGIPLQNLTKCLKSVNYKR